MQGRAAIIVTQDVEILLSEEEYLIYLIKLKNYHEFDLIKRVIKTNKAIYQIKELELELWLNEVPKLNGYKNSNQSLVYKNAPKNLENVKLLKFIESLAQS